MSHYLKIIYLLSAATIICFSCSKEKKTQNSVFNYDSTKYSYINYVNTFIGTQNAGNTYPGAVLPWGMVSVSPHNVYKKTFQESTLATTYITGEPMIYGFGHTHLSGVGCKIAGNFIFNPMANELKLDPATAGSKYSQELALPGYYKVYLDDSKITAEMAATLRTGLSKYTYSKGKGFITLDMSHPISKVNGGAIRLVSGNEIEGYEIDGDFCGSPLKNKIYFVAKISKNGATGLYKNNSKIIGDVKEINGEDIGAYFEFETEEMEEVYLQVGVSYVSTKNARLNLEKEQAELNLPKIITAAQDSWEKELSKIRVEGGEKGDKEIFYSALYRSLLLPQLVSDVNGEYLSYQTNGSRMLPIISREVDTVGLGVLYANKKTIKSEMPRYSAFSLWDTYRTTHPMYNLVYPGKQSELIKSMLGMYIESGTLPLWPLAENETGGMVGDPAVAVIAESFLKGIKDYDTTLAYEAMYRNAATLKEGGNGYRKGNEYYANGYIPEDKKIPLRVWGSVSTALEYSYADYSLAQVAKQMNNEKDYATFYNRSLGYKNYWDKETGFLRSKKSNGNFIFPFDPLSTAGEIEGFDHLGGNGFVEGNAWQYLFFVQHDIKGLTELMGGEQKYISKLQECFDKGNFVLWNEPDMTYPFLFNYVKGEEWRTQKEVRNSIRKYFNNTPSGLPGNDDAGALSSWLVFSMLGIYPDNPSSGNYQLFSPIFSKITIQLDPSYYKGKEFIIESNGTSDKMYVDEIKLNGTVKSNYILEHSSLVKGGKLEYSLKSNSK